MDTGITQPPLGEIIESAQSGTCSEQRTYYSLHKNGARKTPVALSLDFRLVA